MNFSKRLKELREENSLSREQLAEQLKLSYSTIAKYESGARNPDTDTLQKIADYFTVTTDWLLGRTDESKPGRITIPKSVGYRLLVLLKIANELKQNKQIQTNDALKKLLDIVGDIEGLSVINKELDYLDLNDYELLKVFGSPDAIYDFEEELGYDLIQKDLLKDGSDYFIYVCGDDSMSPEINDSDRVLVKEITSINECKDKDIVIFRQNDEYLIRRFYKNESNIVLQANNSNFPPIVISRDDFCILGKLSSILIDTE